MSGASERASAAIRDGYDVVVVGAGPAGIAAAIGAKEAGAGPVLLVDREAWLGGILQQCIHPGFGLKIFKAELTGPEYAGRYIDRLGDGDVDVCLDASVIDVDAARRVTLTSAAFGIRRVEAGAVVFAMGCRERTRGNVRIAGYRPAGVYTAGTAQRLINIEGYTVGERVVVVGSGDIGLIMARRCTIEGMHVEGVVEKLPYPSGLNRNVVQCLRDFDIPLHLGCELSFIEGRGRVRGVRIVGETGAGAGAERRVECDTVLLSVGLIPEIELLRALGLPIDPRTGGPVVDQRMRTEREGLFAAGNLVQVYDLVDWVSLDGARAGRSAAAFAGGRSAAPGTCVRI